MEETLLAFAPAILAVAVAVFLRMRRSIKEGSDKTAAIQKKVTIIEHRIRELVGTDAGEGESAQLSVPRGSSSASHDETGHRSVCPSCTPVRARGAFVATCREPKRGRRSA